MWHVMRQPQLLQPWHMHEANLRSIFARRLLDCQCYSAFSCCKPFACMQGTSPTLLVTWWRLAYWYGFAVQFTVLPFHQEYADSGHFTVSDRISTAIRNNLIFYAVLVVSTVLLLQLDFFAILMSHASLHACHNVLFSRCMVDHCRL